MSRILLAWELGDGLGHAGRLLPIARELRRRGHQCIFALRKLGPAASLVAEQEFAVLQAPFAEPAKAGGPLGSLGDILATIGYDSLPHLEPLVLAWDQLFGLLGVDLLVADYAPTACLAALGQIPAIAIGDAFTLPPCSRSTFPAYHPRRRATVDESSLLAVVRTVQNRRNRPEPEALPHIFSEAERFIVTLPELYPAGAAEDRLSIVGPLSPLPGPAAPARTSPRRYFAYLSARAKGVSAALESLASSCLRGEIFLRDASKGEIAAARGLGLTVHDAPQPLAQKTVEADLLIHHGGIGTAEIGLAVGRPQLLIPRHQEQSMNANLLRRLGVAVAMMAGGNYRKSHVDQALAHLSGEPRFTEAAAERAGIIAARGGAGGLARVVEACSRMVCRG